MPRFFTVNLPLHDFVNRESDILYSLPFINSVLISVFKNDQKFHDLETLKVLSCQKQTQSTNIKNHFNTQQFSIPSNHSMIHFLHFSTIVTSCSPEQCSTKEKFSKSFETSSSF